MAEITFYTRLASAIKAFKESFFTASMEGVHDPSKAVYDYESYEARATRFDILWSYYQGNAYRSIRKWSQSFRTSYGLYQHIRDIYNPANRICEFHRTHIWGGYLDLAAGDGSEIPSALPIRDTPEEMRRAISTLWRSSRMSIIKDQITLQGSVFGDVFLKLVPYQNEILIDIIHPAWVAEQKKNIKDELVSYTLSYGREDPLRPGEIVQYTERAVLTDAGVEYETEREGQPFAWDGNPETWVSEFPFIPMVHIMHNDVGLSWGWSELFPNLAKFREADDQASKLGDQVRKMVDSPWFFAGVRQGKGGAGNITIVSQNTSDPLKTALGRDEVPIIYAHDAAAKPYPLVTTQMDLSGTLNNVAQVLQEIERAYPELRAAGLPSRLGRGDVSGRALLLAQQEAVDKIEQRRTGYDDQLTRLHRMAVAIGGELKLATYKQYRIQDYNTDKTDHRIEARRPVYRPHPTELAQTERDLWVNASLAQRAGVPLDIFLRDRGWEQDRVDAITGSDFYKKHLESYHVEQSDVPDSLSDTAFVRNPSSEGEGDVDFNVDVLQEREG